MNNKIDIKGIIADLDDLCKRLQDDCDDSVPFKQSEEDRLTVYNAIELLEKQIPKKVKGDYHSCPHYRCPNCNSSVKMYERDNTYPHCAFCGQALDWSETE